MAPTIEQLHQEVERRTQDIAASLLPFYMNGNSEADAILRSFAQAEAFMRTCAVRNENIAVHIENLKKG